MAARGFIELLRFLRHRAQPANCCAGEFGELLKGQGMVASDIAPAQIRARVDKETEFWRKTVRQLDIKME
ncbi:hypothetical protein RA8CHR_01888 [Variovorax sp. RA8]|nr:hypothetical protein RA8CHR_01888 [Variovorax sp. RA8]